METPKTGFLTTWLILNFISVFQFEGGLFVTAAVIDSAYKLASKLGKTPVISQVSLPQNQRLLILTYIEELTSHHFQISLKKIV